MSGQTTSFYHLCCHKCVKSSYTQAGVSEQCQDLYSHWRTSWLPGGHAILLVQYSDRSNSRTYSEHDTVSRAMDDICQMYEQVIKMDGGRSQAKYTIEDLWAFVDRLEDIACLVYDTKLGEYRPHNREWIKNQVLKHLKVQLV
ncbi:unnamed protein product [Durusdinium trenchii]|uniref:Enhancer of rudimentary homolog n=1 Tax=Durusdinium trenchii TaxID=1381693 RepID=A0ABP0K9H8_9DINO